MKKLKLNIQLFAVSKSTSFSEPALTDEMITANYSTLKITIKFSPNNNVTWFSSKTLKCTCNGVSKSANVTLSKGGSVSKTFEFTKIAHNSDGKKSVSWSWSIATGTSVLGTLKDSGTKTLQTIPRASKITSVSSGTAPYNPIVKWTPHSTSFYHILQMYIDSTKVDEDRINTRSTSEISYDKIYFSDDYFSRRPNNDSMTASMVLITNDDSGNTIGSDTKTFEVKLNPNTKPTASIDTLSEANSTMKNLNWNIYVKNHSQLNIPITASGINGSTIKSVKLTVNGQTFSETPNTNVFEKTFTTGLLNTSGTNTISLEVTDSRNRKTSITPITKTFEVKNYSNPSITTSAKRVNSNNVEDDEGQYINYSFVGSITNVGSNAHRFRIGYREKGTDNFTYKDIETNSYSINKTNQRITDWVLDTSKSYDVRFEAIDTFNPVSNPIYTIKTIDTGFDLMNFNASGNAMAIGKVSEAVGDEKLLEIALPTKATEKIETAKCFKIPQNSNNGYGLVDHNGNSIIKDWNNGVITVNATGGVLFLGHQNTTDINMLDGKFHIYGNGTYKSRNKYIRDITAEDNQGLYYKLLNIPASSGSNAIQVNIKSAIGNWVHDKATIDIQISDRDRLNVYGTLYGNSNAFNHQIIVIYKESNNSHTVYLKNLDRWTSGSAMEISWCGLAGNNDRPTIYVSSETTYNPTGTLVWTSSKNNITNINGPTSLYDNSAGTSGNITLSESSANFSYLEIYYFYYAGGMNMYKSTKVYQPNGKIAIVDGTYDNGTRYYTETARYTISGNSLTRSKAARWRFGTNGENNTRTDTTTNDPSIKIYKVVGYR